MQRGFSLVELSIVLVILGLLTGGILAGQSLIRAAELRSVSTEYQRYVTAAQSFRDKYFAIPGDFPDATRFWTRQVNVASCVTNSSAAVSTPGACDGNGDGLITVGTGGALSSERFQFWRHLAHAGLIEGTYSGLSGASAEPHTVFGTNAPTSRLNSAGWYASTSNNYGGSSNIYAFDYGNHLMLGGQTAASAPVTPVLKPEEAWNIDTKMDDGKPARGRVVAMYWNNLCAAADDGTHANNDLNASYRLSDSSLQCALYFAKAY